MLLDETLIELFDTDIGFKRFSTWQFKVFCSDKKGIF